MQELWPVPSLEVDLDQRLGEDSRPKPPGRPWVMMVMIASIDGAIAVDGLSGGLGSSVDHRRFLAARRASSVIVVGSATARAEDYQPTTCPIAVVSGRLSLEPTARLFADPERRPILFTTSQAARTKGPDFDGIAEVVDLGDSIEPGKVLADLDSRGMAKVMLEGGPTLNGHFLRADLVDEVLMAYSPLIVGGDGPTIAQGPAMPLERRFRVDRIGTADDLIFVRYLRSR